MIPKKLISWWHTQTMGLGHTIGMVDQPGQHFIITVENGEGGYEQNRELAEALIESYNWRGEAEEKIRAIVEAEKNRAPGDTDEPPK